MPRPSSSTSSSSRRSLAPLVTGALAFSVLLASWKLAVEPALPPRLFHGAGDEGDVRWIPPHGTFLTHGPIDDAEVVFVGDSRMSDAIVLDVLAEEGLERHGVLWGASARLVDLLAAVRELPARRLVVGLSVLSLERDRRSAVAVARRGTPPPEGGPDLEERLAAWVEAETGRLVDEGFDRARARLVMEGLADLQRDAIRRRGLTTEAIDERLNDWADRVRREAVKVIEPERWSESWVYDVDETRSDEVYRARVEAQGTASFAATAAVVGEQLAVLVEDGWQVVCVRLPVAPGLRAVEETALPASGFAAIAERAGVPYLDYDGAGYGTRDGSHLVVPEAERFTRALVRDLEEVAGW